MAPSPAVPSAAVTASSSGAGPSGSPNSTTTIPVVIAATRATVSLTQGQLAGVGGWLGLLAAFDLAFLAAGYLVFGHLLED